MAANKAVLDRPSLISSIHHFIFTDIRGLFSLVAMYVVAALWCAWGMRFIHDEGILMYELALSLFHAPAPAFFYIKSKTLLSLLYMVPAVLGYQWFLLVHVLLSGAAVFFSGMVSRLLRFRSPNVAALVMMLSVSYFHATVAGFQNSTACFFLVLFLWSYLSRKFIPAGLLLGTLVFIRHELAAVVLVFMVWDIWERRDISFILACAAFPFLYLSAGAIYHAAPLWFVTFFPRTAELPPELFWGAPTIGAQLAYLSRSFMLNVPLFLVFSLFSIRTADRRVMICMVAAVFFLGCMSCFQLGNMFGFDNSLRYHVSLLPLLALLANAGLSHHARNCWYVVPAVVPVVLLYFIQVSLLSVSMVMALTLVMFLLVRYARYAELELFLLCVSIVVLVLGLFSTKELYSAYNDGRNVRLILQQEHLLGRPAVYSDKAEDGFMLSPVRHYFLGNACISGEFDICLNKNNGQYAAFVKALSAERFIVLDTWRKPEQDAVFVLSDLRRSGPWVPILDTLHLHKKQFGHVRIYY